MFNNKHFTKLYLTFLMCFCITVLPVLPLNAATNDVSGIESYECYYIKNLYTGKYLDVQGGGTPYNGQNVMSYPFHGLINQQWRVVRNSNGTYKFISCMASESHVLDITGSNVDIWIDNGASYQQFSIVRDNTLSYGGTYYIKYGSQYVTANISTNNVAITASGGGLNSMWSLQKVNEGDADIYSFYYENGTILWWPRYYDSRGVNSTFNSKLEPLGYSTYNFVNLSVSTAYSYMQYDDVWVFRGHGISTSSGNPMASIAFMSSTGDWNGVLTANSNIFNGVDDRAIDSLSTNALASNRCILYIGCSTASSYTTGGIKYNLVDSTYQKGAQFALGTTQTIYTIDGNNWTTNFLNKAYTGGTIRQCIDNANYYEQDLGLLYYYGDVYKRFN